MAEHLTEEEQIEAFKRWWKENGTMLIAAVVIAAGGYFGFGLYQSSQEKAAQANSALYDKMASAVESANVDAPSDDQTAAIKSAATAVVSEDDSGLYGDLARFQLAKIAVDAGELDQAESHLREVVANSDTQSSVELAKLRLARVQAAAGKTEEALAILDKAPSDAFKAGYAEAKGDVLLALGRLDEAYTAFESANLALEAQEGGAGMRGNILKFKMDNARVVSHTTSNELDGLINPHAVSIEAGE